MPKETHTTTEKAKEMKKEMEGGSLLVWHGISLENPYVYVILPEKCDKECAQLQNLS